MTTVLHKPKDRSLARGTIKQRVTVFALLTCTLSCGATVALGAAQYPGGGGGGLGGRPGGSSVGGPGGGEISSAPAVEKPDAASKKAFNAGMKSLNKALAFDETAAKASDADKKSVALEKAGDAYNRALDMFTEALSNKGDMVEAWEHVGFVHLRLGAYIESIDDYNHVLAMKPDLLEAMMYRAQAYLHVDRLDEAKSAYMDLFNHDRTLADRLMPVMQQWVTEHRANANGMRASDVDSFEKWVQERDGIAKQSAAGPH